MDRSFLTPDVVAAVMEHMNGDHREDNVVICRGVGHCPDATQAEMIDMDEENIVFRAETAGGSSIVRIPFRAPLRDRPQIRAEVAQMFHDSVAMLAEQ